MDAKIALIFSFFVSFLSVDLVYAADISITAPSGIFLASNRDANFRFFVKNNNDTYNATVYISLEGYSEAKFWGASQRKFENFSISQNGILTITNLKPNATSEFFVLLSPKKGEQPLSMICNYQILASGEGCGNIPIAIEIGDIPSFSVINSFSMVFLLLFSAFFFGLKKKI